MAKKHIFKYPGQAEYAADAASRPTDTTSLSQIAGEAHIDGVNVITNTANPERGDAVFFDKVTARRVLVKHGTLVRTLIDSNRYFDCNHTVVGIIYGKVVVVANERLNPLSWASGDEWLISNINTNTAGSMTLQVKYYGASGNNVKDVAVSWGAGDTIDKVVDSINNFTSADNYQSYVKAYKVGVRSLVIVVNGYSTSIGVAVTAGDATAERSYQGYQTRYYEALPHSTEILRAGGEVSSWAMANYERYYAYYQINGVDTEQTLTGSTVKRAAFTPEINPGLYAQFNGDYDAYMKAHYEVIKVAYPTTRKSLAAFAFGDTCKELGDVRHVREDGEVIYDFPQWHAASQQGVVLEGFVTGFEPGTGHLGGLAEAYLTYEGIPNDNSDVLNKTIVADGGTVVSNNVTIWLAFQSYSYCAWIFYGNGGYLGYGTLRVYGNYARVFRAFEINEF